MKNQSLDVSTLIKYMIPVAIVVLAIVYTYLRKIVLSYTELRNRVNMAEKAAAMRQSTQAGKAEPVIVRRTDLYEQLTPQQKLIHKQAEDLAVAKNFREAAKLFESINFQRKAIDLLEFNGFIEEAAQTLLRMKVPYRAAIIYERNSQFVRAAECFTLDNKHDSAARSYEKAAQQDFHLFKSAGLSYLAAGMIDGYLEAFSKILLSPEILKTAYGSQKYEFLAEYMADPFNAKYILENLTASQLDLFLDGIPLRPNFVQSMSVWVLYRHDLPFFDGILFKLIGKADLATLFWSHISEPYVNFLIQSLTNTPDGFRRETYQFHGKLLTQIEKPNLGELFMKNFGLAAAPSPPASF